ncbi:isocitrate lyase/PEP mutase family protein [Planctellipticum variicoloris]|uniref:isocitrate lyase/PEP mutase family protein n=1 Tax=Planctellipticum variicoloris TaxID=3064265 RepID=UPI0030132B3C|nr:oxaloacetate decarboxylase [Planctomycetaceae bacterium SH412]
MSAPRQLRELLARPGIIRSLAPHDVFSARIMEQAGIELLFLGGFGASASLLGLPDTGLITQTEIVEAARRMTSAVRVPVIVDADTGHGDVQNIVRTVRELERAGAAGLLLEDQVFPKRCGHFPGKQVTSAEEMLVRLRAALDARVDPDFTIIARTDALTVHGVDDAIGRAQQYAEAGADVCFVEAPRSVDELARIAREIPRPQLANMLVGGATPILSAADLEQLGYRICVSPVESLAIAGFAVRALAQAMLKEGRVDGLSDRMLPFAELQQVLGVAESLGLRERFEKRG